MSASSEKHSIGCAMLCAVVKGPSLQEVLIELKEVFGKVDLVELRIDCLKEAQDLILRKIQASTSLPLMFTLRSRLHGGNFEGVGEAYLAEIKRLIGLKPDYIDIESHAPSSFVAELRTLYKTTKIVASHHDFSATPPDLDRCLAKLKEFPADIYKIATHANDSVDALRLLSLAKRESITAIGMGKAGVASRVLAPVMGPSISFSPLHLPKENGLGQLSIGTLIDTYQFRSLEVDTAIYGLIGEPIEKSISDMTHNQAIRALGLKAVYVKMPVLPTELSAFFKYAMTLPFKGFSVTMPLKEAVLAHVDCLSSEAEAISAVNTIVFENGKWVGHNTDGRGALNAIERRLEVHEKKVVLIGTGGAAKAIAHEAKRRGAKVTILGRDVAKAKRLADRFKCLAGELGGARECDCDILINCTPNPLPIDLAKVPRSAIVMDIQVRPATTLLLEHARERGSEIIFGYEMFIEQAILQFALWFKQIDCQRLFHELEQEAKKCLAASLGGKARAKPHPKES